MPIANGMKAPEKIKNKTEANPTEWKLQKILFEKKYGLGSTWLGSAHMPNKKEKAWNNVTSEMQGWNILGRSGVQHKKWINKWNHVKS